MATQAAGIPRQRGGSIPIHLQPGTDLRAVTANVTILARVVQLLVTRLNLVDDKLSRRMNEMMQSDILANRPPAGIQDRIFLATDQAPGSNLFYDDGTTWILT